ncbi:MAG: hypothetical protein ACTS73_01110 [Arsenophonus sp. NEOnobi-MAG3]
MLNAILSISFFNMPISVTLICNSELYRLVIGDVEIKVAKVRGDHSGNGIYFNSLLASCLKHAKSGEEFSTMAVSCKGHLCLICDFRKLDLWLLGAAAPFLVKKHMVFLEYHPSKTETAMA